MGLPWHRTGQPVAGTRPGAVPRGRVGLRRQLAYPAAHGGHRKLGTKRAPATNCNMGVGDAIGCDFTSNA